MTDNLKIDNQIRSRLWIDKAIAVDSYYKRPCAWNRFWMWALLGWKWEAIK